MNTIGSLEELILMIILKKQKCHGVEIGDAYELLMDKSISLPTVHVVLKRMEKKGWVKSAFGEPTAERGGKRKRYYQVTSSGYNIINELQRVKSELWLSIKNPSFQYGTI